MLPRRIYMLNFMGHIETDIDCTKFNSCLIVGKNKKNPNISNGVGKSTIYKAIDFVLYGEYACDKIEEIIRDEAELCKVIFEFELENAIYQIIRQRSKSGTHIYLNQFIGDKWESLTAKTNTQTEAELHKLIKISYKAFKNSISFAQSDLEGICSATPDKRKELLKEPLNISIYNKFHKIAKKRLDDQNKELDRNNYGIQALGSPEKELEEIFNKIKIAENEILLKRKQYDDSQNELIKKKVELSELQKLIKSESTDINAQLLEVKQRIREVETELSRTNSEHSSSSKKMEEFKKDLALKLSGLQDKVDNLKKLKSEELRTPLTIQNELDSFIEKEQRGRVLIAKLEADKIKFSQSIPEIGECVMCFQEITNNHREKCLEEANKNLETVLNELKKYNDGMEKCISRRKKLELEQRETAKKLAQIDSMELEIANWKNNINKTQELVNQYNGTIDLKNTDLLRLNSSLESLKAKQVILVNNLKKTNINELNIKIDNINILISKLENENKQLLQQISSADTLLGILKEKKVNTEENILKLKILLNEKIDIENKISLQIKVVKAYSSHGIPSLIINTILDDLQIEANMLLAQLRPSLQFQFKLDKNDEDVLDIIYKVHDKERSYRLLSGGQKMMINICMKLALSKIIQRRLGVDIKFILLDEVDQSLDKSGVDDLAEVIKKWQNNFKIFLITHNRELKEKFSDFIIVEGEDRQGSKAHYSTSWDEV